MYVYAYSNNNNGDPNMLIKLNLDYTKKKS